MRSAVSIAIRAKLKDVLPLRALFLQELNVQIRYDACHERGWTDSYLLTHGGRNIGYGSVKGREIRDRDTVFEFYVIPAYRKLAGALFRELLAVSGAEYIECQSNDPLLSSLLVEHSRNVTADTVLFQDHSVTEHVIPGAMVRRRHRNDRIFEHRTEPVGEYVLALGDDVVATGGFLLHYNMPFADLYMEVREDCRRRGFASYLLQEVKKECYLAGRVPAARCSIDNAGSRGALTKAGLRMSGFMLTGILREEAGIKEPLP